MAYPDLEPVTPDPKKLLRTAFILTLVMIVGGIVILKAYEKRSKEAADDDRPSFVTRISEQKDLVFMRQDGELKDLVSMKGKVIVVQCLPSTEEDPLSTGVMKRISERYRDNEDLAMVTLMLDPGDPKQLKSQLAQMAETLGAKLPQWTVASNERPTLHKFIKNEFKATKLPTEMEDKWDYDRSLFLIDKNRHVRKAVIPKKGGSPLVIAFDFEEAQKWDQQNRTKGLDRSNVEQLELLLGQTVDTLLKESVDVKPKKSPVMVLYIGSCFILFFVILIIKSRRIANPTTP